MLSMSHMNFVTMNSPIHAHVSATRPILGPAVKVMFGEDAHSHLPSTTTTVDIDSNLLVIIKDVL